MAAPKEPKQRLDSTKNWVDSDKLVTSARQGKIVSPDALDFAVMRMRAAAWVMKPENMHEAGSEAQARATALQHVRDAMLLAYGVFTEEDKAISVLQAQPVTRNGITQLEPTHVTKITTKVVTEYKVLFSPWTWIKLKLLGRPTVETTTRDSTQSFNEVRGL